MTHFFWPADTALSVLPPQPPFLLPPVLTAPPLLGLRAWGNELLRCLLNALIPFHNLQFSLRAGGPPSCICGPDVSSGPNSTAQPLG